MHRKRISLPIVFIISVAAIFLYSYHNSSLNLFVPENPRPNPLTSRQGPVTTPSSFTFTVKLLAFDRIESLRRCLRSLSNADYGGDRVSVHVYVDHFRDVETGNGSVVLDRKLEEARQILGFLDEFKWGHGEKLVHYRTGNVGLQAQWLESWWPVSNDDFAFVVEDDLEVSPLYYRYLKGLIAKYYYDPSNFSPWIYGASLQRPRFVAGKHGNTLQLDNETHIFLYQLVGTWGQLLFPNHWKEFRLWYDIHKAKGIKPVLQGMITTGWYKKMGERIWTPWFIKFIHSRGYYNIYTNFLHERALSISHRDAGVNYRKTAGPDSFLLGENLVDSNYWKMQPMRDLKWYDFCFREMLPDRVVRSFDELQYLLGSLQKQKTIILVSLYRMAGRLTRNLICHLERLNIHNCIFIGIDSESLLDLARRGHAVIDANQLMYSVRRFKLMGLQRSEVELVKEILVKAYVIKKCLEYGYSSWVVDGNIVPATDGFPEVVDPSYDFFMAKDIELLFVKNSQTSVKIWVDEFIYKVAAAANSLKDDSVKHRHFVYFVTNALEETGSVKIAKGDELNFGVKLAINSVNSTSLESGKKMIFWSPEMGLDSVEKELENMGMWLIDGDSSCTAVFCHKSW